MTETPADAKPALDNGLLIVFSLLLCCGLPILPIYLALKGRISKRWGIGLAVAWVAFGIVAVAVSPDLKQDGDSVAVQPAATASAKPKPTEPVEPTDPGESFEAAVKKALGKSNRGVTRVEDANYNSEFKTIVVWWAINENLTDNMIRQGAQLDIVSILEVVQEFQKDNPVKKATFVGTYSMVDRLGNASEDKIVEVKYSGDTIKKINFDNFMFKNVYDIADRAFVAPAFQPDD